MAIVGETGSGKSTLAKLLTRLMDPIQRRGTIDGVDLRQVRFGSLRNRVVLVPQEGFLFDATLLDNIRFGAPEATEEDVRLTVTELGLDAWLATLPQGLATDVGQRGESLSAGERQLVALARAYLADPDLLVLDEATSAVDPSTEVRLQRALDSLTRGRTSIAIAHRLSTAQAADEVIVVDARSHRRARAARRPRRGRRRLLDPARLLGVPAAGATDRPDRSTSCQGGRRRAQDRDAARRVRSARGVPNLRTSGEAAATRNRMPAGGSSRGDEQMSRPASARAPGGTISA